MYILGASRGGRLAYAYANQETQLPSCERNLKGIITVDIAYQFDPCAELWYCNNYSDPSTNGTTTASKAGCERCQILQSAYNSGRYYDDTAVSLKQIASLADVSPDTPSPIISRFTNHEVGELALSATYILTPMKPLITRHHYCTGIFNKTGHPKGLQFTNYDFMIDLADNMDSFMSINCLIDEERVMCNNWATCDNCPPPTVDPAVNCPKDDVLYADHLDEITIPALYVGGETGYGGYGNYTISLLGSEDKTIFIAPGYGHIDVLYGDNAKTDVWKPIYKWIRKHRK